MARRYEVTELVLQNGRPVGGASVAVKDLLGNPLTLYSTETGSVTETNPTLTSSLGRIDGNAGTGIWVEAPDYDIDITYRGATYTQKVRLSPPGVFNLKSYGAVGDGATDDSTKIQAAIDAANTAGNGTVRGLAGETYVCESIEVSSGVTFDLQGITIKHKANSATYCIRITGDDAEVMNGHVDGNSLNQTVDLVVIGVHGNRSRVEGVHIYDAEYRAIQVSGAATQVSILNNSVYKVLAATACRDLGIVIQSAGAGDACTHVLVAGNHVRDTTKSGLGVAGVAKYTTFANNVTVDTGEDGIAAYDRSNEHILAVGNSIFSPANNGIHLGGRSAAAVGNTIRDVTFKGVFLASDPNTQPTLSVGAVAADNLVDTTSSGASGQGIVVQGYTGASVAGNLVRLSALSCYEIIDCIDFALTGNVGHDPVSAHGAAIRGSVKGTVAANTLTGGAQGISIVQYVRADASTVESSDIAVTGNVIQGNSAFGVQSANLSDWVSVIGNNLRSNSSGATSLVGSNNKVAGNIGSTVQTYTATNVTTDRSYDADTVLVAELADIVGTLIADLRAQGVVA